MYDGEYIDDFHKEIFIENSNIQLILKYRVLKHIVEQRKKDEYNLELIICLFNDIQELVQCGKYLIVKNKKDHKKIFLIEMVEQKTKGVVLVLEIILQENSSYFIKTGFYRAASKIKKLMR